MSASSFVAAAIYRQFRSTTEDEVRLDAQLKICTNPQILQKFGRPVAVDGYKVITL